MENLSEHIIMPKAIKKLNKGWWGCEMEQREVVVRYKHNNAIWIETVFENKRKVGEEEANKSQLKCRH